MMILHWIQSAPEGPNTFVDGKPTTPKLRRSVTTGPSGQQQFLSSVIGFSSMQKFHPISIGTFYFAPPELEISVDHYSNVLGPSGAGWGDDETLLPICWKTSCRQYQTDCRIRFMMILHWIQSAPEGPNTFVDGKPTTPKLRRSVTTGPSGQQQFLSSVIGFSSMQKFHPISIGTFYFAPPELEISVNPLF